MLGNVVEREIRMVDPQHDDVGGGGDLGGRDMGGVRPGCRAAPPPLAAIRTVAASLMTAETPGSPGQTKPATAHAEQDGEVRCRHPPAHQPPTRRGRHSWARASDDTEVAVLAPAEARPS
jgi:hypothetical protein